MGKRPCPRGSETSVGPLPLPGPGQIGDRRCSSELGCPPSCSSVRAARTGDRPSSGRASRFSLGPYAYALLVRTAQRRCTQTTAGSRASSTSCRSIATPGRAYRYQVYQLSSSPPRTAAYAQREQGRPRSAVATRKQPPQKREKEPRYAPTRQSTHPADFGNGQWELTRQGRAG